MSGRVQSGQPSDVITIHPRSDALKVHWRTYQVHGCRKRGARGGGGGGAQGAPRNGTSTCRSLNHMDYL